jgi:CubicO group peptidase (beta-lactamase class C family)
VTKPIVAAATMMLVDDGRLDLSSAVADWLPELAEPRVLRTRSSPIDDVVGPNRAITLEDLLTFRSGWGFPSDFSYPGVAPLFSELQQGPLKPGGILSTDQWMERLGRIPMLSQPGETWLYNTSADILGVLISRVSGRSLGDFLAERIFEPLGMVDSGFSLPPKKASRLPNAYRPTENGSLELIDSPASEWTSRPAFESGAGGLLSTADDLLAFGRMLLANGWVGDRELLSPVSVTRMTTNHITPKQRADATLFLDGQGWGFGGSVDVDHIDPWNVDGRYGWVGGSGTAWHITPANGSVTILLTQTEMTGPRTPPLMHDFWTYAAGVTATQRVE